MGQTREVDFHKYCETCEHKNDSEFDTESPCYECMDEPVKIDSRKPVYYKERE